MVKCKTRNKDKEQHVGIRIVNPDRGTNPFKKCKYEVWLIQVYSTPILLKLVEKEFLKSIQEGPTYSLTFVED